MDGLMEFRHLGNSGMQISEITYGNWLTHGSQVENDVATQCVRAALDEAETMSRTGHPQEQATAQLHFHQALVHLIGSSLVDDFFENAVARLRVVTANVARSSEYQQPFLEIRKQICSLIETGQRDQAAAMMTYYIDKSIEAVADILRSGEF